MIKGQSKTCNDFELIFFLKKLEKYNRKIFKFIKFYFFYLF